ncbi:MAG: GDP-L-fucose synthase [Muribaculaceae bacterium]|nr:GDP-L-fucose synthase [Muribaculaceae bacterium]
MIDKSAKIYVAGHRGLVGSAIMANLRARGFENVIGRTHAELDLLDPVATEEFFRHERPDAVVLAAAHVGGIMANSRDRADFIYQNLQIQQNVIGAAYRNGCRRLLFLGSTCIYPREAPQPIPEDALLTSPLEYTNEPYAIAKIAGLKMCEAFNMQYGTDYVAVMPTNLYGPNDNFHLEDSHVLPAMIRKLHLSKLLGHKDMEAVRADLRRRPVSGVDADTSSDDEIERRLADFGIYPGRVLLWGSGRPLREFLWSEDMADACVHVLLNVSFADIGADLKAAGLPVRNTHINIGTGRELSIAELAALIADATAFDGTIEWDASKPDGTMRKLCSVDRLHSLGWTHSVELPDGIKRLYDWYLSSI